MCRHGIYKKVFVLKKNKQVSVDACIAVEIEELNRCGVITLGCCCGHGKAGRIVEYENGFGKWKAYELPPHTLIDESSVTLVKELGYKPFPYYYADGDHCGVWQMYLKTGCMTEYDVEEWHENN